MAGKFVYVLSSSESDYFAEMTAVSLASLRLTNPTAHAALIIDSASKQKNRKIISDLIDSFDEIINVDIGDHSQIYFSRYMKVHSRKLVSGNLLYIDSDTVILKDLSEIWQNGHDVGGVLDLSSKNSSVYVAYDQLSNFRRLNWKAGVRPYINGGVFYMKDSILAQKFCDKWIESWNQFGETIGKYNDQPSFNHAINHSGVDFFLLPQTWNAQIGSNPLDAKDAKIVHVYSGQFETRRDTILHLASHKLKAEGVMDIELLKSAIGRGHAWTALDTAKKNFAMRRYAAAFGSVLKKAVAR